MKRALPLVALLSIVATGCSSGPGAHVQQHAPEIFGNSANYDAYVERRTTDLLQMGVTKDRSEAASQARIDAERRYGPRTPPDSAMILSTKRESAPLKMSQIDAALARAREK